MPKHALLDWPRLRCLRRVCKTSIAASLSLATKDAENSRMSDTDFDWADPLQLTRQLSTVERALRDSTRDFCSRELAPRLPHAFREEASDVAVFRAMGQQGLLGMTLPAPYGGGLGQVAYGLAARELERIDSGYRTMMSVQSSLVMGPIHAFGSDAQKDRYLPALARGEMIGCFALTEPGAGSDPGAMASHARKVAGGYVISGRKTWISHAPIADVILAWARTDDGKVRGFLIDKGSEGLDTPTLRGKIGLRVSITGDVVMDNVFVPDDNLLPGAAGLGRAFDSLDAARYGIAWGAWGAAEDCWLTARQQMLERHRFGRPLAANQLVQLKLADMQTEITLGLQACLRLGRMREEGNASAELTSMMKRNSAGKALHIARVARDMLGGDGLSDTSGVMRHMVNLEAVNTYEGTHDIHALVLGRAQTGLQAFSTTL